MQDLSKVHVIYPILTDVIELALRLHVAWGHPWDQNDGRIYRDRGHVEFNRWDSRQQVTVKIRQIIMEYRDGLKIKGDTIGIPCTHCSVI